MTKYQKLLDTAPDSNSPEFIDFLRKNNSVVYDGMYWIIIENTKYHEKRYPHYTAFAKTSPDWGVLFGGILPYCGLDHWHVYKNHVEDMTITRPHIHIVKNIRHYITKYLK